MNKDDPPLGSTPSANTARFRRRQVEEAARAKADASRGNIAALSPEQTAQMLHELHVHQIEPKMQNDALLSSQLAPQIERERPTLPVRT